MLKMQPLEMWSNRGPGYKTWLVVPCFPLDMSTYWQSLGWVTVLRIWKRPRILMELGVRGRPLLPHTSWGRAEAKKVKAPSWASLRGLILPLAWNSANGKESLQHSCMHHMNDNKINDCEWKVYSDHWHNVTQLVLFTRFTRTLIVKACECVDAVWSK